MTKNWQLLLWICGLCLLTLLYVRSRFLVVELGYEVSRQAQHKSALEKRKRELNLEISVLQNPRRIEEKAKEQFGLSYSPKGYQKKIIIEGGAKK